MVVLQRHFIEIFVAPLLVTIVFVILFRISVIVFAQKMYFLISIQVSHVNLLQCHRCIHTLCRQTEFGHQIFPFIAVIYLKMNETPFLILRKSFTKKKIHLIFAHFGPSTTSAYNRIEFMQIDFATIDTRWPRYRCSV